LNVQLTYQNKRTPMISFKLSETTSYTFTGSLAQKILGRLSHYSDLKESEFSSRISKSRRMSFEDTLLHEFEVTSGMLFSTDRERIKQKIIEDAEYKSLRLIRAIEVIEDYETLTNAIDKFKYITGIRDMENFIESKSKYISLLESCQIQSIGVDSELDALIPQNTQLPTWQRDERSTIKINYLYWDAKEVESILTELKHKMMHYIQEIDRISALELLEVPLHRASVELLGL